MRSRRFVVTLVATAGLALAGCGGDDDGGAASEKYIAALAASFMRADEDTPLTTDEGEARCAAEGMVDALGQERLEEAGATIEALEDPDFGDDGIDVTEDEAISMANAVIDCVDVAASFASSIASDGDFGEADSECVGEHLEGSDQLPGLLGGALREGDDFTPTGPQAALVADAFFECVSFGGLIAESAAEDGVQLTDEQIACIDEGVRDNEQIRERFAESFASGEDLTEEESGELFLAIVGDCVPLDTLSGGSVS